MTDIARERRLLAEQGLEIRRREQWGARFDYTDDRFVNAVADDFFLHIAVVNDPGDLIGTEDQVARTIENIGISRFPNTGISYNALAFNTGRLYEGQPLTRRGAHTVNDKKLRTCPTHGGSLMTPGGSTNLNYSVRALCLPQQCPDPVTDVQIDAAARWAAALIRAGLAKRDARWHGHRCCAWKDCPCNNGFSRIPELLDLTRHYRDHGLGSPIEEDEFMALFKDKGDFAETVRDAVGGLRVQIQPEVDRWLWGTKATKPVNRRLTWVVNRLMNGLVSVNGRSQRNAEAIGDLAKLVTDRTLTDSQREALVQRIEEAAHEGAAAGASTVNAEDVAEQLEVRTKD